MVINWYGEGCFKIQTGGLTILTDPFDSSTGLTPPRFKSDITIKTQTDYPLPYNRSQDPTILGPGEYEIKGIEIFGWPINEESRSKNLESGNLKTVYLVKAEEMTLGFLGPIAKMPEPAILENFGQVDILFIPAGGSPHISAEAAHKLIKQINPKFIVAAFFKIPDLKEKRTTSKNFLVN